MTDAVVQEEARRVGDERYRRLLDFSLVPIAIYSDGAVVYANPTAAMLVGAVSVDQVVGRSILDFVPVDDQAQVLDRARQVQEEGRATEPLIGRVVRLDGQVIEVEVIAVPTIYAGQPATEVIIRDVTAQRRAEDALRREEEQLQLIVQASGLLLGSLDRELVLTQILELAQRHIAADAYAVWRRQVASGEWQAIASAGLSDAYRVAAIQAMNHSTAMTETPLVVENMDEEPLIARHREVHRLHGTEALLVVPLRIHNLIAGTLAFYYRQPHRFTEREVHVATALANLAGAAIGSTELYQEQARLRAEAEAAVRVQDQFLALLSHDLKNPLTAIKARTQLLQRQLSRSAQLNPDQLGESLADIASGVNRTLAVLNDLVAFGQVHPDRALDLQREPTDLVAIVKRVIRSFQPMAERHDIQIETSAPELIGSWDGSRIERVLENLLANAIKFSPKGGTIVVMIDRPADDNSSWAILRIQDQGVGIPPEDLPYIFEPFRRGRNVPVHVEGMGLGLAGVRTMIRQHGGTIDVVSELDQGSTFTVRLPLEPDRALSDPSDQV